MADNFTYKNATATTETGGADDVAGIKFPRIKLIHGADGINDGDVSTANPLPVVQTGTPGLPTGAATSAKQDTVIGHLDGVEGLLTTIDTDTGNIDAKLATAKTTDFDTGAGTDIVQMLGVALPASGGAVPGGTSTNPLRTDPTGTTAQPVSGTVTANAGTGTMAVSNSGLTALNGAISGTEVQTDIVASLPAGTNNIGDVDVLTQPARARTTDTISAADATDVLMNGTTALTPKFAIIDAATSGNNTLIAAVTSKKIRVHSLYLVAAGTTTVRFEAGADGTALSGQMNLVANTGFVLPYNPLGWFETTAGVLLNLELSAAISVDGGLTYTEV